MSGLDLLQRILPRLFATLLKYVLPVILVLRFLVGSTYGLAILSGILYFSMWQFGESKPLTPAQLALWIDDLPPEAKTAFVSVILTVLGFLVAFHTATANWKAETQARMRIEIANQVEDFFNEVLRLSDNAMIFADRLSHAVEEVKRLGRSSERDFRVQYAFAKAPEFLATRDRLTELSIRVHRLGSRHNATLLSVWGAPQILDACADSLEAMAAAIWIKIPFVYEHDPDRVEEVIKQLDVADYRGMLACFEKNKSKIAALSGALQGLLMQPLTTVNFAWIAGLGRPKLRTAVVRVLEKVRGDTVREP